MRLNLLPAALLTSAAVSWLSSTALSAQAIAEFTFDSSLKAAQAAENVTVSVLSSGAGTEVGHSSKNANAYIRANKTDKSDLHSAIDRAEYISFTVVPDPGYALHLTALSMKAGYSIKRDGARNVLSQSLLSSVDGFTVDKVLAEVATSGVLEASGKFVSQDLRVDLSALSQFQEIKAPTEFRIYVCDDTDSKNIIHRMDDLVLSGQVVQSSVPNAPQFSAYQIDADSAAATQAYSGSLAAQASDPDGDALIFSKIDGPAWLQVAADGTLSGAPQLTDMGANTFTVRVDDNDEGASSAQLSIFVNDAEGNPPPAVAAAERIRLVWVNDPTSTVTVCWDQVSGSDAVVKYGAEDLGRAAEAYPHSKAVDRAESFRSMQNRFARLEGLLPDTNYYFVLEDSEGVSPRYWFRTAPERAEPFTFIAGGDSRNNRTPRLKANRLVAKLRPLFVAFTGDMINADNDSEWVEWLDDWQHTNSADGRMYPLLPHRGNHENQDGNGTIYNLFDTTEGNYYALSFGGDLLRFYVLNSESDETGQATWMLEDLDANGGAEAFTHLMAGYHKPMRPHTKGKGEGRREYDAWAQLFYDQGFELVFESDTHMMKRTQPLRPSIEADAEEGFVVDTDKGTVYVGEGCWGAPLRECNDGKSWTRDMGSFNGFDLVQVFPEQIDVLTVKVDNEGEVAALAAGESHSLPQGLDLWQAKGGTRFVINRSGEERLSYAQYQLDLAGGQSPIAGSSAAGDLDGDGLSNYVEFALGMDPTSADSLVLPGQALPAPQDGVFSHRRRANSTVQFSYYSAADPQGAWTRLQEGTDYTVTVAEADGYEAVQVKLSAAVAGNDSLYYKVEID